MSTSIRAFQPDDLPALAEIRQAAFPFDQGDLPRTLDGIRREMELPGSEPASNVFVAESEDGGAVGFASLARFEGPNDVFWSRLSVRPDARGDDTGRRLLETLWNRALARRAECDGRAAWFQFEIMSTATWLASVFEQAGMAIGRYSLTMFCPVAGTAPRDVLLPEGIELRIHRHPEDDHAANAAANEAFRDHWGHVEFTDEQFAYMLKTECRAEDSVVAWAGDEIAGGCYNDFSPARFERTGRHEGYVATLGVRRPWRKLGLATAMLNWTINEALKRGLECMTLGVDAENLTGAKRLYERVGFREIERWVIYRKQLPA